MNIKLNRQTIIQNRLLELEKETRSITPTLLSNDLQIEKAQLEKELQFILDERNSWKSKIIWNIIVPVIVSVVTAYIVTKLNSKI